MEPTRRPTCIGVVRRPRVAVMTLAFLVAACTSQAARVGAPSQTPTASPSPSPAAAATPRRPNATNDVLYVRRQRSTSAPVRYGIDVIDARSGEVLRELPNGLLSPDGKLLFSTEWSDGGTRTIVHISDLATGKDVRSYDVGGELPAVIDRSASTSLTPDGRWLALSRPAVLRNGQWVTEFAAIDTTTGALRRTGELTTADTGQANCCPYAFQALSPDGRLLYLSHPESAGERVRVYDLARGGFISFDVAPGEIMGWTGVLTGYRTPYVMRGGIAFSVFAAPTADRPYVLVLYLDDRVGGPVRLPADQRTNDFDKYLLWSLAVAPDGSKAYAVNPALGVVDEIDVKGLFVRRTAAFEIARDGDGGTLARLRQVLFPVAEAKRYLRSGAVLSPDGTTLYAIGEKGVVAIDTTTLGARLVFTAEPGRSRMIDSLAISPDGARLYAVDDQSREILILDARQGMSSLGTLPLPGWADSIIRIETP